MILPPERKWRKMCQVELLKTKLVSKWNTHPSLGFHLQAWSFELLTDELHAPTQSIYYTKYLLHTYKMNLYAEYKM